MLHQIMKSIPSIENNSMLLKLSILRWYLLDQGHTSDKSYKAWSPEDLKANVKAVTCSCGPVKLRGAIQLGLTSGYRPALY